LYSNQLKLYYETIRMGDMYSDFIKGMLETVGKVETLSDTEIIIWSEV
jgi:hypothetical protein